jgi:uncharacterized protein
MALTTRAESVPDGRTLIDPLHIPQGARERMRGLLGFSGLGDTEGMWFPKCRIIHTLGMQFPIDLVYLTEAMEVCKVVEALRPTRLSACLAADSVIELNAGAAKRLELEPGTRIRIVRPTPVTSP